VLEQTTTNTGVLHCVQDDDVEQTTTKEATTKEARTKEARTKEARTKEARTKQRQMRGSFTAFRMTTSEWMVPVDDSIAVAATHSFRMTTL
jgi:hypothetical protein